MIPDGFFMLLLPEIVMTVGALTVLLMGLLRSPQAQAITRLSAAATVLIALFISWTAGPADDTVRALGMQFSYLNWYVRVIALSVGLLVLLVNWHLPRAEERGDMFGMILFSLTGILFTALADDLVLLFMAIELVSVPTYVLVSVGRSDIRSQEAGVKYFFLGAMSAALLVYGFSYLYGVTGTTVLSDMALPVAGSYATLGLVLAFAGVAFKIAAVPFHVYAADVYQGAASPITGLLGYFPKLAGFVALIKLLFLVGPTGEAATGWGMPDPAFWFLWITAAATMTIGNVLGLMQTNVKRILAYSSVAHSGYMLLALLAGPVIGGGPLRDGMAAMLFYMVVYGVMNLGAFAVLALVRVNNKPAEELDDLAGLWQTQPLVALAMAICIFSLMGMPPTAGFLGKVYVFSAALSAGASHPHATALIVLTVIGVLNAAVAAAYYLRIVGACYFREPETPVRPNIAPASGALQIGLLACCIVVLILGLWPKQLMQMSRYPTHDLTAAAPIVSVQADEPNGPE